MIAMKWTFGFYYVSVSDLYTKLLSYQAWPPCRDASAAHTTQLVQSHETTDFRRRTRDHCKLQKKPIVDGNTVDFIGFYGISMVIFNGI
jgi:hypothetical protein